MGSFAAEVGQWVSETQEDVDEITIKSVLEVRNRLIVNSPVDRGHFRGNWQYGLDRAPDGETYTVAAKERPAPPPPMPHIAAKAAGHVHYLVNNVPYANRIEDGHSSQAPAGVVALRIAEWPSIVGDAVASVSR